MDFTSDTFETFDGLTLARYTLRGERSGPPRGVVVLVHGFVEHAARYAPLAEWLVGQGFDVVAMDLRGHGRSEGARVFVRRFDDYLADLDVLGAEVPIDETRVLRRASSRNRQDRVVGSWGRRRRRRSPILRSPFSVLRSPFSTSLSISFRGWP